MDQVYFSPTNGLPSESKLATYMSRQNVVATSPQTVAYGTGTGIAGGNVSNGVSLIGGVGMSKVSLIDSPQSLKKVQVPNQSPEFIPARHVSSSPNFYPAAYQSASTSAQSPSVKSNSFVSTPIKGRSLLANDSPQTVGVGESPKHTPRSTPPPTSGVSGAIHQENVGGTTYFYPASSSQSQSSVNGNIVGGGGVGVDSMVGHGGHGGHGGHAHGHTHDYAPRHGHMYSGPASCILNMQPKTQIESAFFIADELRDEVMQRNELANMMDLSGATGLPEEIENNYHSLYALEAPTQLMPTLQTSSTYRAINSSTGAKYCIRRLHGVQVQSAKCMTIVDQWKKVEHSNVVHLKEVFTTKSFNDRSLLLIYDYHPGSQTMMSKYFTPTADMNGYADPFHGEARPFSHKSNMRTQNGPLLPESEIWAIVMQLTAGLRAIHQAGLACRTLDPTKIIFTAKRVRYSFVGINDIVERFESSAATTQHNQQEDLLALGKLILALACRSLAAVTSEEHIAAHITNVQRTYSQDLRNLLYYLLQPAPANGPLRCVTDLMPMIGARFYTQLDALQNKCDVQEDELAKEMENGRLYRLILKLGTINERPELNLDGTWSETGDRYMLKLYRDYLLHAVTEDGRPWLDHAHIVQSLNKLDAGVMEKVNLMSRDENTILVVTYAELKHCLEQSFNELCS